MRNFIFVFWKRRFWIFAGLLFFVLHERFAATTRGDRLWATFALVDFPLGWTYYFLEPALNVRASDSFDARFAARLFFPVVGTLNALGWLAALKFLATKTVRGCFDVDASKTSIERRRVRFSPKKTARTVAIWSASLGAIGVAVWAISFRDVPLENPPTSVFANAPKTVDGRGFDFFAWARAAYPDAASSDDNVFYQIVRDVGFDARLDVDAKAFSSLESSDRRVYNGEYFQSIPVKFFSRWNSRGATRRECARRFDADRANFCRAFGLDPTVEPRFRWTTFRAALDLFALEKFPDWKRTPREELAKTGVFTLTETLDDYLNADANFWGDVPLAREFADFWLEENADVLDELAEVYATAARCVAPPIDGVAEPNATEYFTGLLSFDELYGELDALFVWRIERRLFDGDFDGAARDVAALRRAYEAAERSARDAGAAFYDVSTLVDRRAAYEKARNLSSTTEARVLTTSAEREQWALVAPPLDGEFERLSDVGKQTFYRATLFENLFFAARFGRPLAEPQTDCALAYVPWGAFRLGVDWNLVAEKLVASNEKEIRDEIRTAFGRDDDNFPFRRRVQTFVGRLNRRNRSLEAAATLASYPYRRRA